MAFKVKGASYLQHPDDASSRDTSRPQKRPLVMIFASLMAVFTFMMVFAPFVSSGIGKVTGTPSMQQNGVTADAFGWFCSGEMGAGMNNKNNYSTFMRATPNPEATSRKWTLQEAYGTGLNIVNFNGIGDGTWFTSEKPKPEGDHIPSAFDDTDFLQRVESVRTATDCFWGGMGAHGATFLFSTANMISGFTQFIVTTAFDSKMICSETSSTACIDLIGVIGGDSDDDNTSLIAILTDGIYMPLMVLVIAIAGISVAWQGIVKRQVRESFGRALWVVLSALLGVFILAFPAGITQLPMIVSNGLASCIIGSFNGDNCFSEEPSGGAKIEVGDSTSNAICASTASGLTPNEQMSMTINSLSCSIWKSFVLEPYSNASFGLPFAELDTMNSDNAEIQQMVADAGLENEDFCVNLRSSGSVQDMEGGKTMYMDNTSQQVCNVVAYQMFLKLDARNGPSGTYDGYEPASGEADDRWYNVVAFAAQDDGVWNEWGAGFKSGMQKFTLGFLAIFTSIFGGIVLVITAFYALIFKIGAIILTALAPLFLLFMIEPTRGKGLAAGWFGQILSNVLKYMASALFLLIAIVLYGALLANAGSNVFANFVFVLILTGALIMYRREIVDMIGQVDMGTKVLSNKFTERIKGQAKLVGSVTAGAVGAGIAGGSLSDPRGTLRSMRSGAKDTFKRDLARGAGTEAFGSFAGKGLQGVTRQYNRTATQQTQQARQEANAVGQKQQDTERNLDATKAQYNEKYEELQTFDQEAAIEKSSHDTLHGKVVLDDEARADAQQDIAQVNPDFAEALALMDQMKNMKLQAEISIAMGDHDKAREIMDNIDTVGKRSNNLMSNLSYDERREYGEQYQRQLAENRSERNIADFNDADRDRYNQLAVRQATHDTRREGLTDNLDALAATGKELEEDHADLSAQDQYYGKQTDMRMPGDEFTRRKRQSMEKQAGKQGEKARDNISASAFNRHVDRRVPESEVLPDLDDTTEVPVDTEEQLHSQEEQDLNRQQKAQEDRQPKPETPEQRRERLENFGQQTLADVKKDREAAEQREQQQAQETFKHREAENRQRNTRSAEPIGGEQSSVSSRPQTPEYDTDAATRFTMPDDIPIAPIDEKPKPKEKPQSQQQSRPSQRDLDNQESSYLEQKRQEQQRKQAEPQAKPETPKDGPRTVRDDIGQRPQRGRRTQQKGQPPQGGLPRNRPPRRPRDGE